MRKIIYFTAASVDGFTAGRKGDRSLFVKSGSSTTRRHEELDGVDTVIMCRQSYEAGFGYGLTPGQPLCEGLVHYIFSNSMQFDVAHPDMHVLAPNVENVTRLKEEEGANIFLYGGGYFAGWLLENGLIDTVKLRINPAIVGDGERIFGQSPQSARLELVESQSADDGVFLNTYRVLR